MPAFDIPINEVFSELGLVKTRKSVVESEVIKLGDSTLELIGTDIVFDINEDERKSLGRLFGISSGYAKKMPWDLFASNINFWLESSIDTYLFETVAEKLFEDKESVFHSLHRATVYTNSPLTRDRLLSELFEYVETYEPNAKLKSMGINNDMLQLDLELNSDSYSPELGLRLIADLNLKKGIKWFYLWNAFDAESVAEDEESAMPNWFPLVVSEPFKVSTRGKDSLEVYEAIQEVFSERLSDRMQLSIIKSMVDQAASFDCYYDKHNFNSLLSLATSKNFAVSSKLAQFRLDTPEHGSYRLFKLIQLFINSEYLYSYKSADIHNFQRFLGSLMSPRSFSTCHFCFNKIEHDEEVK